MQSPEPCAPTCWESRVQRQLKKAGMRATRHRLLLASLLFRGEDRHVTVEELHEEAERIGISVSLATVYNTLNQFTHAGLVRLLAVEAPKAHFDTNTSNHHHFFIEDENRMVDIPGGLTVGKVPVPPEGMEIVNVDVVIRVRRCPSPSAES